MIVEYFLSDHLGSTSITTDSSGAKASEIRYKAWGEIRYSWKATQTTTPAYKLPLYTFTGQASYMDDPTTSGVTEGFGLMFYQSRFYDPALGRFAQADSIIPPGVQGLDRYAFVYNTPLKFADPSGHDPWGCNTASCEQNLLHRDGKGKIKLVSSFYVGDDVPRNLTEHEAEIYTHGAGNIVEAVGDAASLVDDIKNIREDLVAKNNNVFVYATYDQYSDGSVSLQGVTVYNESDYRILLERIKIESNENPMYDIYEQSCLTGSQCYLTNPPQIKNSVNGGYLDTVDPGATISVNLVPSGNPTNMTNRFGLESLSAKATLYFIYMPYPHYTNFTIPLR